MAGPNEKTKKFLRKHKWTIASLAAGGQLVLD